MCRLTVYTWVVVVMWVQGSSVIYGQMTDPGSSYLPQSIDVVAQKYPVVRSRSMAVNYRLGSMQDHHLDRIELWYARGEKGSWQLYDYDNDRVSPIHFAAPAEGLYRFLVVAVDRWGRRSFNSQNYTGDTQRSSPVPPPETKAQQVVFIDYTPPKLYLYSPRGRIDHYRSDNLQIRWQGFDSHLPHKPVKLFYSLPNSSEWVPISQPLVAEGHYDWTIPDRLQDKLRIHATIMDRAGNVDSQSSGWIQFAPNASNSTNASGRKTSGQTQAFTYQFLDPSILDISSDPMQLSNLPDEARSLQAQRVFRRAKLYSQRFEWAEAIKAYNQTLLLDPTAIEAKVNLANAYFRTGEFEKALEQFERVLLDDPSRNNALFGLAQTQRALNQYDKALVTLDRLLEQDRSDFQAWRMHAESAEKLGQMDVAKNSWLQASNSPFEPISRLAKEKLSHFD